ncbi:hypothetical protein B0J11DRAFT_57616 [Dendryphion nanum]|uniref:Zn(2)-C6 fungal-type domain-containing protein n=1 Tax=Dendryphion nanum TaxID=256645 RepID=A0A9P9DLJ2_9PLEO|nr:hypothetical protein B0J11DRAFT_57616 [Dendryphion nanum]
MGPKRASDDDLNPNVKLTKLDHVDVNAIAASALAATQQRSVNQDFSGSVKKKLATSTRTGQACDRCKVRKIRCDGRPEGCSPCAQNRTPCKTTDRITGKATTRGHAEVLEGENAFLRAQIVELQNQVREMGQEPRALPSFNPYTSPTSSWPAVNMAGDAQGWADPSMRHTSSPPPPAGYVPANGMDATDYRPLPQFKTGSLGDNYLGVSSADSLLSHIKGTSLSVFGTEVDITDFVQNEDYDNSVMSYNHFLKVALNEDRDIEHVPFPAYQSLVDYATWYLRSLNPYTMLLHRPTFMELIWRIGNEPHFEPSPAETVSVHMMLAIIKYQISVRNGQSSLMEESHQHYRFSLSFFKDLHYGHSYKDVCAMTLICLHMRNFPKPGAAWIMVSTTFLLAIELGLHRSTKAWADSSTKMDTIEIETRKRVFWTLHALATNLSGKLGRPMPINISDIDVEFPEPIEDCLSGDVDTLSPFHRCSFQVGIQTAKYTVWSSELYRTVYAVRQSPQGYEEAVRRLEKGIHQWKLEIPSELSEPTRAAQEDYIFALYLEHWDQEYQLLLHHPALCRSTDPDFVNSNLDKCLAAAQKMLHNCNEMRKIRSLDIPWINAVVYIAAIFTSLFIHFQRKDQMTSGDMTKLKSDMAEWIDVMGECGTLLGSDEKLKNAVQKIVEQQLSSINDSIVKRTATESLAQADLQAPQEQAASSVYGNGNNFDQFSDPNGNNPDASIVASNTAYAAIPAGATFSYSNGTNPQANGTFEQPTYGGEDVGMTPSHAAALAAAASDAATQRPDDTYSYANAQTVGNSHQAVYTANGVSPNDWRQWTKTYMQPLGLPGGEYLNTANTLMTLGGRQGEAQATGQDAATVESSAMQGPGPSNFQWPGIAFDMPNGHVNQ